MCLPLKMVTRYSLITPTYYMAVPLVLGRVPVGVSSVPAGLATVPVLQVRSRVTSVPRPGRRPLVHHPSKVQCLLRHPPVPQTSPLLVTRVLTCLLALLTAPSRRYPAPGPNSRLLSTPRLRRSLSLLSPLCSQLMAITKSLVAAGVYTNHRHLSTNHILHPS